MCNSKLIGVRYFNKGLKEEYNDMILSTDLARDTTSHGTMISVGCSGSTDTTCLG